MRKLLLSLALSGTFLSAMAAEDAVYFGINGGLSNLDNQSSMGWGLSANAGYQFNKYLGLEGNYSYFSEQDLYSQNAVANPNASGGSSFFMGAVKGMLPLNDMFDLYAKVGAGVNYSFLSSGNRNFVNGSDTAWTPATMVGGGIEWKLHDSFGIVLEDMVYSAASANSLGNANLLSLGLNYKF